MAIKITVDEANEELKETKRTYELAVPVMLNEYEIIVAILYDETIHPDEPGKNWLKHFEIAPDDNPLPYPTNYLELECRLVRVLKDLYEKGELKLDKGLSEILEATEKITEEIKRISQEHEILN